MYASNHFDKKEMTEWENKPEAIKNDFNDVKTVEGLVRDYEVYEQNSGGTAGKHYFESANQATKADCDDELHQYVVGIAQAAVKQEEQATNIHDSRKASMDAMAAQIKTMSDQIARLTKAMANKENASNGSSSGGRGRDKGQSRYVAVQQYTKPRSMGSYCSSHGFHPAGKNHTSATCTQKLPNHNTRRQLGMTEKAVGSTGHHPYVSALSSRTMQHTQASQPQQTDRDRGRTIANKKRTITKQ